jgi:YfiR/HmsC-like
MLAVSSARAAGEYELKAAFIYNVLRFSEWPADQIKDGSVTLCILGRDPFSGATDTIRGRQVQGRELQIKRVGSIDEGVRCNALFVSASEEHRLGQVIAAASNRPVLTFSDIDRFADRGGVVGMFLVDDKLRFDINIAVLRAVSLRINAQVLKLAQRVLEVRVP